MDPDAGGWPSDSWGLTAPESYVLQARARPSGAEAFKLALRELVLKRVLGMEGAILREGSATTSEPALLPVLDLYHRAAGGEEVGGVPVEQLAKQARREFGRSLAGYVNEHVYPALEERGLLRTEESRLLGLFPRRRRRLTAAGREAAEELRDWLRIGDERLGEWTRDAPDRALAYAGGAGAALLLMPALYPELERLGRHAVEDESSFHYGAFGGNGGFGELDAGVDAGGGFDFGGGGGFDAGGGFGGGDGGGGGAG
jgi:Golgi phosphoprotein 3 (GPP34)